MSKITCDMINDLIPLYMDNVLSDDSKEAVREHVSSCPKCQKTIATMRKDVESLDALIDSDNQLFQKINKRFNKKFIVKTIVFIAIFMVVWFAGSIFVASYTAPIWPKADEEAIKQFMEVTSIDGTLYLHHTDLFGRGDIMMIDNTNEGVLNFYLGEHGIQSLGILKSWHERDRYQALIPATNPDKITCVNYCKPDGTVIANLWNEGDELPEATMSLTPIQPER
ncbi:MAG: zf-HC2 domain-containing protein [Eubacteriales bacterium]|nr:zf-HC2 domain-containing protein [Eubacteriales bacterium]